MAAQQKKLVVPRSDTLAIPCWPQLRAALSAGSIAHLGDTPEEVARFLIIDGLDRRHRERCQQEAASNARIAATYR